MRQVDMIQDTDVIDGGSYPLPNFRRFVRIEFDKPVFQCIIINDEGYQFVNVRDCLFIDLSYGNFSTFDGGLTLKFLPQERRRITLYMSAHIVEGGLK